MTTSIGAKEAARLLGVTTATLYAYVSRGQVSRRLAVDGRTSLYDLGEIEQLAHRSRRRAPAARPSIDVQIATAVTRLDDGGPIVRGHDLVALAEDHRYEQVAELVITGELPADVPRWPLDRAALDRASATIAAAGPVDHITALGLAASAIGDRFGTDRAPDAGRHLLAIAPSLVGGPRRGDLATRLAATSTRRPPPESVVAVSRALVLLVDHGLATSTLAVRVAASVRARPPAALATGLAVVSGPYHGAAGRAAAALFDEAAERGARATIHHRLEAGLRLPGFGHSVYRNGDPRFAPLMDAIMAIPADTERRAVVDAVLGEAGRAIGHLPNIDLALGALSFVGGIADDCPIFAIARIAGWVAHYDEEIAEKPVRFRGLATPR